jgi:hypothetical protein
MNSPAALRRSVIAALRPSGAPGAVTPALWAIGTAALIAGVAGAISGMAGGLGPSAPAFGLMLSVGVAFGQFGGSSLPWWGPTG